MAVAESGLYYFGARYMQDKIGQFVSADSVGPVDEKSGKVNAKMLTNPQKLNRYAYAINKPERGCFSPEPDACPAGRFETLEVTNSCYLPILP